MIIWVLTDDRIGGNNQSISIAEKINPYYVIKKICYNFFIKIPNFIRQSSLIGVDLKNSDNLNEDNLPDVVICGGRRLASVALNIKKRNKGKTFIINIMNPNLNFKNFDLVILPKHDKTPQNLITSGKVLETSGSLNRVNLKRIEEESEKWKETFKDSKKPLISLIIGGDTKNYKFNPKSFGEMINQLSNITKEINGTLLITTSRRTSDACILEMKNNLDCDYYLYDWKWENDERNNFKNPLGNPYFAFLGLADFLVVTADSMSMVSEACSTGKPTYIYMIDELSKKHKYFCETMIKDGYIKNLDKNVKNLEKYSYQPLNEVERLSKIIIKKIQEKK